MPLGHGGSHLSITLTGIIFKLPVIKKVTKETKTFLKLGLKNSFQFIIYSYDRTTIYIFLSSEP